MAPVPLDDRGQKLVTLTQSLLTIYQEQLMTSRSQHGYTKDLNSSLAATIARCVSYSVWAYLNPGVPFATPTEPPKEEE